jgi:hypothetical protein
MATFKLSDITGCISPTSGLTTGYDITFTTTNINSIMKKDDPKNGNNNFINIYIVSVIFGNSNTYFKFENSGDRDSFFTTLSGLL